MSSIRALSQELAARSDAALRELFLARPDLVSPPVPDFAALAARACARISVQRALDTLDTPHLQVLEAVLVYHEFSEQPAANSATLKALITGSSKAGVEKILRDLNSLALLYRDSGGFSPVSSLYEVIGAHPAGLGRSYSELARPAQDWMRTTAAGLGLENTEPAQALAARFEQQDWWSALLAEAPEKTIELLARFEEGPLGLVPKSRRSSRAGQGADRSPSPLDFLLDHGILVPLDAEHVELPREAGIAWREGRLISHFESKPPIAHTVSASAARRDNAALGSIAEVLREIGVLLTAIAQQPLPTLRTGGVGVRALRPLAQQLESDVSRVSVLLELSAAAGLIVLDADTSSWTAELAWWDWPREEQWLRLALGWLRLQRSPALVGQAVPGGQGTINLLAAEGRRADAPQLRQLLLQTLAQLTETSAAEAVIAVEPDSLLASVKWQRPRLWRRLRRLAPGILAEAELLGLTGSGALTDFGRLLSRGQAEQAAASLREQLPAAISTVLLQADLTAIAPGFLEPRLSAELSVLADREGQGPAATYRFSASSLRRALDAGREPARILDFLSTHSSTAIPQPLEYLIRDTAARHGLLRVEGVSSVIRSPDEALLSSLLHETALQALGLHELAPGVLGSQASPAELARALRELGMAPALGGADQQPAPAQRSLATAGIEAEPEETAEPGAAFAEQIASLRSKPAGVPANSAVVPQLSIETLREAIRSHRTVRLTVVDGSGNPERLRLVPLAVSNGRVRVFDPERDTERVMSIHRIVDVDILDEADKAGKKP